MFVLLIASAGLWITYGLLSKDTPVIATNIGMLGLNVAILTARIKYGKP